MATIETSALSKIKAGLASRGHSNNFTPLEGRAGMPLDFKALQDTLSSVLTRKDVLKQTAAKFNEQVAAFEAQTKEELASTGLVKEELPTGRGHSVQDLWGDDKRKLELEQRMSRYRKEQLAPGAEGRDGTMKFIRDSMAKADHARPLFTDPVRLLHRQTVGESSRRIYRDNLEGTRPATLEAVITEAALEGNKPKLAAALDVLDAMPREQATRVNVSRTEAAAYVMGPEFIKSTQMFAALDLASLEAEQALADIEGRRTSADTLRKIGLLKRELQALHGEIDFETWEKELMKDSKDAE